MEHRHRFRLDGDQPFSAEPYDYPKGFRIETHTHEAAQLIHAIEGAMGVTVPSGHLVVPPQRAVWIPPGMMHSVAMMSDVSMRTVYVAAERARCMPSESCVVSVSGLMRHLILAALELPGDYAMDQRAAAIFTLLFDEIRRLPQMPLHLREPRDKRLLAITRGLEADPADNRPLSAWASRACASERTLARLFARETGMTFAQWRQQLRLIRAIGMLATGAPVTSIALDLGYATPSAFAFMFRRSLGAAPLAYFRSADGRP